MSAEEEARYAVDVAAVAAHLDPGGGGGRRDIDTIADALVACHPDIDPLDLPEETRRAVDDGHAAGLWEPARQARTVRGAYSLPRFVTLRATRTVTSRTTPDVALRPELNWAADLALSPPRRR